MRLKKCDICGNEMPVKIPPIDIAQIKLSIITEGYYYDMCDECKESLQNWMYRRHRKVNNVMR